MPDPRRPAAPPAPGGTGFTLIEVLVALTIMSTAMAVVIASFVGILRGWTKGGQLLDELHHGDFVMEQTVSALRSMAFFHNAPEKYGFRMEDDQRGDYPTDFISFVTSGTAFVPATSPLVNGLHRLEITIDEDDGGEPGVLVRAIPHLVEPDDYEGEGWIVSREVKGLEVRFYSFEQEDWEDEWEDTNAIPSLVEVTFYMDPLEEYGEPYTISRVVEIPVAPVVDRAVQFREEDREDVEAAQRDEAEAEGAVDQPQRGDPRRGGRAPSAGTDPRRGGRAPNLRLEQPGGGRAATPGRERPAARPPPGGGRP